MATGSWIIGSLATNWTWNPGGNWNLSIECSGDNGVNDGLVSTTTLTKSFGIEGDWRWLWQDKSIDKAASRSSENKQVIGWSLLVIFEEVWASQSKQCGSCICSICKKLASNRIRQTKYRQKIRWHSFSPFDLPGAPRKIMFNFCSLGTEQFDFRKRLDHRNCANTQGIVAWWWRSFLSPNFLRSKAKKCLD